MKDTFKTWGKAIGLGVAVGLMGLGVSFTHVARGFEEDLGLDILFKLRGASQPPRTGRVARTSSDRGAHAM